jgi:hypothetical protein
MGNIEIETNYASQIDQKFSLFSSDVPFMQPF